MSKLITELDRLQSLVWYSTPMEETCYSPCDDIRFKEALGDAYPKLRAVVEVAQELCSKERMSEAGLGYRFYNLSKALRALEEKS